MLFAFQGHIFSYVSIRKTSCFTIFRTFGAFGQSATKSTEEIA